MRLAILIATRVGHGHLQKEAFRRLVPLVRVEAGCIQYDLHEVENDPDQFLLLEQWESQSALDLHDIAPHMVAQDTLNRNFRAGPATVLQLNLDPVA